MSIHELSAPEDRDRSRELNGKVLRGELDSFVHEKRYLKKDGALVWVRVTVSAIRDASGTVRRTVGTVEDITQRKRVEEDLNRERALLQGVFENIPVLPVLWDQRLKRFTPDAEYRAEVTAFMRALQPEFRGWFGTTKRGNRVPIEWAKVRLRSASGGSGASPGSRAPSRESLQRWAMRRIRELESETHRRRRPGHSPADRAPSRCWASEARAPIVSSLRVTAREQRLGAQQARRP